MITFPDNTPEVIDAIRNAIGRPVLLLVEQSKTVCPTCGVNPVTDTGLDPFCPVCSGDGYLYTYQQVTVTGHITWQYNELPNWITGGQFFTGDCIVQIKFTPEILQMLEKVKYIYVDNKRMTLEKRILRGVPNLNRVILDLKQED